MWPDTWLVAVCAGFELIYEGDDQEFLCEHLMPGQTYRLHVACCSRGGHSEVSAHYYYYYYYPHT